MSESRVAMTATPAGGAARSGVSAIPSLSYLSAGLSPVGEEGGGMATDEGRSGPAEVARRQHLGRPVVSRP